MPWIESHTALARHPKTLRLARGLGATVPAAIGHLHMLWWWAIEYAQDGDLSEYDPTEIAVACMWDGDAELLLRALAAAGFLNPDGTLHDWGDYAGRLIEQRRQNVARAQAWRQAHKPDTEAVTRNVQNATTNRKEGVTRNERVRYGATKQDLTVQDQTVPPETSPPPTPSPSLGDAPDAVAPDAPRASRPSQPELVGAALVPVPASTRPPTPVPKETNPPFADLWLALDGVVGEARTPTEKGRRAKACKELRQGRYTAADILAAAEHWDNVMGDATMSDFGLTANMGKLLGGRQVHGRSNGLVTGHKQQVTEYANVNRTSGAATARAWRPKEHAS